jgi:hypothetical protein
LKITETENTNEKTIYHNDGSISSRLHNRASNILHSSCSYEINEELGLKTPVICTPEELNNDLEEVQDVE